MPSRKKLNPVRGSNYSLDFLPEVESDTIDAYNWYELQRSGLGAEFLISVETSLNRVVKSPLSFPVIFKKMRRALVNRFPFGIFFMISEKSITVMAVVHLARHPKTWRKRI